MNPRKDLSTELAYLQDRLDESRGKKYWRTLEELADTGAFQELVRREFPEQASHWPDGLNRRRFLALMSASLAMAGLNGCSVRPAPSKKIVPYVRAPEQLVPGKPLFYATAMTLGGSGVGLLVKSNDGRPTKVEGNPDHPASRGGTDLFSQASVLGLYDPDRSQAVTCLGQTRTWDDAIATLRSAMDRQHTRRGAGLRVLTETVVSPTLGEQISNLVKAFPEAKWHQFEPINRDAVYRAAKIAFGEPVATIFDFLAADLVVSIDANFLSSHPGHLRYAADFIERRRLIHDKSYSPRFPGMNRLYVVEPAVTNTGAKADHRLALRAGEIEAFARALAARIGVGSVSAVAPPAEKHAKWIDAVAKDLTDPLKARLVIAGDRQPVPVHLLAHAMNQHLRNIGGLVNYIDPIEAKPVDQMQSLRDLVEDMDQRRVEVLVILGGNPVFTAPADFRFAERIQSVPLRVHLSLCQDETSRQCHWHLPEAHYLESWSDTRAYDGTASIVQPLIEPLYGGHSAHEILAVLSGERPVPGYDIVRGYWREHWLARDKAGKFEDFWQTAVHDGIVAGTTFPTKTVLMKDGWEKHLKNAHVGVQAGSTDGYEIVFQPDPTIYDGRFANNGWLQELPKPITTITWDNAAIMSPATAKELDVDLGSYAHGGEHGGYHPNVVELELGGASVRAPIWIMPGHADRSITVYLGYGRKFAGRVGGSTDEAVGFNAYELRNSDHPWFTNGLRIRVTGDRYPVACTQQHHLMENRDLVRVQTFKTYESESHAANRKQEDEHTGGVRKPLTMYQPHSYTGRKWGMAIDLTACTGCMACVVACQAENNIPVVGKEQVAAGREMHWLRIDRYTQGSAEDPTEYYFQPVLCMHCENAPCEYVCPVEATVHSADGLNDMVYQRCVGTRFCSNNCPYKVRRFNFFAYADFAGETRKLQYNPDVTVRSRGVMEKCSYCVQRIRRAEIQAEQEGRPIFDGEILTACQAACPANAILFGDINDSKSRVKTWKESPLNYGLLEDLNTEPRTTYLAALRNPNPELEAS
jgi:molybdopterin-containing oxidoreductase family iron-sulfur binding subunit